MSYITSYFYDSITGLFDGSTYSGDEESLQDQINHRKTVLAYTSSESIDYLSQKIDISTKTLIEYQPPAPPNSEKSTWSWSTETKRWVETLTNAEKLDQQWINIKSQRDQLLQQSDWRVVKATDTGVPLSQSWKDYRQALRDITLQSDPFNITWPVPPA